ncbi:MAG: hypothetical protein HYV17_00560, partial [Xanthomonadales bacterium]|nr:hypothetical protein [Xanthomonadales bacterium]
MERILRKFAAVGRRAGSIGLALLALPLSAQAALTVTPLTWNIVGLDSNSPTTGPQHFPVGARICAGPGGSVGGITADLVWDSANAGVYERPGSDISLSFPALAAGACTDAYYEIEVDDVLAPYDTTRRYHISATDGSGSYSSPTPRELYVEHLVSQSRNAITNVRYGPNPLSLTAVAPGGGMNLVVGNTYTIELSGGTATQGYEQFEAFINFTNTIFQILDVSTTYSADTTPYVGSPHSALYGDACLWENDPASPNYRACLDVGKIGGSNVVTLYTIKIIGGGGTSQTLNTLLYDFSGSSYHYNADFGTGSRIANIIDPTTATIAKSFTPSLIPMNGISTLKITLANPNPGTLTGYNFDDFLPAGMSVATPATFTTSNCGTPTFAPSGGDVALAFSNGTVAANSSCTITVGVTAGAIGSYVNTTDHLFIDSTDTGDDATATLTVNNAPPLPPLLCGITLGRWNFESGFTVTAPAASSSIVTVTAGAGAGVNPQSSAADNTVVPAGTVSWRSNGGIATTALATTNNDYFEFSADTSAYDAVYLAFDGYRTTNGPRGVAVYAGSAAGNPETGTQLYSNGTVLSSATTWFGFGSGNSIGVVGPGATTYFRIYGFLSNNTNPGADFNLDNVVINGCVQPVQPTIGKAFAPNPIAAGANSILTFTLNNPNAAALSGATFSDTLPAGMTVATAGFVSNSCGFIGTAPGVGDGSLAFSGGTIPASSSCSVSVRVTSSVPGPSTNISGFISTTQTGENSGPGGSATATLTVIVPPVIAKNFDPSPILAGGVSTLTFSISNPNTNNAISGVAFSDTFPATMVVASPTGASFAGCGAPSYTPVAGAGSISFSGGNIVAGGSCTVTVDVTVPANGTYVNTSGNVSHLVNAVPVNGNTASDTLVVDPPNPAIGLLKEVGPTGAGAWAGFLASNLPGTVFYRFTIENLGDVPLSPITLTDPDISLAGCVLPASLPVADASDDDHIFSCVVGGFAAAAGSHPNTATAGGSFGATPVSDTDTATYASTGLTLVKSAAPATYTAAGEVITYTFTVTNSGAATLSGPISVIDDQTSNETCPALTTVGDLDAFFDPGEVIVCSATYTITALDVTNTSVTNIAYASNGTTDSATDTETVTLVVAAPALNTAKALTANADGDGSGTVTQGDVLTFTITVTNTGNVPLTNVVVSERCGGRHLHADRYLHRHGRRRDRRQHHQHRHRRLERDRSRYRYGDHAGGRIAGTEHRQGAHRERGWRWLGYGDAGRCADVHDHGDQHRQRAADQCGR